MESLSRNLMSERMIWRASPQLNGREAKKKGLSQDWLWERGKKASPTAELRFMG